AGHFDLRALEGSGRELADIEEILATQVLVTLGMVTVDAGRLDGGRDAAVLRLFRIQHELTGEIIEATIQPAVAEVGNLEHDKLVLALLIELVDAARLAGHQRATEQQRKHADKEFLVHINLLVALES